MKLASLALTFFVLFSGAAKADVNSNILQKISSLSSLPASHLNGLSGSLKEEIDFQLAEVIAKIHGYNTAGGSNGRPLVKAIIKVNHPNRVSLHEFNGTSVENLRGDCEDQFANKHLERPVSVNVSFNGNQYALLTDRTGRDIFYTEITDICRDIYLTAVRRKISPLIQ